MLHSIPVLLVRSTLVPTSVVLVYRRLSGRPNGARETF